MAASTHNNYLPVELLLKIFLPQPVKSLLRLQCVCKLWYQVISSNSFIEAHFGHHKTTANKYILRGNDKICSISFIDGRSNNVLIESHNCNMIHRIFGSEPQWCLDKVHGICNGLVCLSDCNTLHGSVFLWNPIVNKVKKLPIIGLETKNAWRTYLCFGYYDDDYKVIKVAPFPDMYHVYVYGLSTNCWELYKFDITGDGDGDGDDDGVDDVANRFGVLSYPKARFVNGVAYFVKQSSYGHRHRILCFDLRCEMTTEINFPEEYENFASHRNFTLEEYEESIALIELVGGYNDRSMFDRLVMWVLRVEPSHNSFSWDKKYTLESEKYYLYLKDFINNENLVIKRAPRSRKHSPQYFLYNVHEADSKRHPFKILTDKIEDKDEDYDYWGMDDWGMLLEEKLVLLDETTIPPFVETQSCSANATGRRKKENEDRVIHRGRLTKEATRRIILSNKFNGISI